MINEEKAQILKWKEDISVYGLEGINGRVFFEFADVLKIIRKLNNSGGIKNGRS